MYPRIKHLGLILGLLLVIISFLFFAREQTTYNLLLIFGLVLSSIFFLLIVAGKATPKEKLKWTGVVLLAAIIQQLTENRLIALSYRIYINQNQDHLASVNNILSSKKGSVFILGDGINAITETLTTQEKRTLLQEKNRLGVWLIERNDKGIYYGIWGFQDVRLGIIYWTSQQQPVNYRHVAGQWYY